MSLATRCTACGTIFRVVQDQLRVSEGWVRCGRCAEVFDARQQLFDMEREAPPPWNGSQPMPLAVEQEPLNPVPAPAPMAARPSAFGAMHDAPQAAPQMPPLQQPPQQPPQQPLQQPAYTPEPPPTAPAASAVAPPVAAPAPSASTTPVYETHEADPSADAAAVSTFGERIEPSFEANFTASVEDHAPEPDAGPPSMLAADAAQASDTSAMPAAADEPAPQRKGKAAKAGKTEAATPENYVPSFMRHPKTGERGRRPGLRAGLMMAAGGALGIVLAVQAAVHWRDAIAAAYPPARGALEAMCRLGDCRVEPWRRIDVLSVENSALAQAGAGNQYQLSVSLRNKAGYDLALPWIDLSLTDAGGVVVTRRALAPTDFRLGLDGKPVSIAAGAEQSLQVVLNTGGQKVSGYTVEIFNP